MALLSLSLSYLWSSAFSDNFITGGLLPYKDAKNYFLGASLLANGIPMAGAGQATERPLFPGFLGIILLMTGQNLKISIAIITQLLAIGIVTSARQIVNSFGVPAASVFATLLYFYIQPLIGYSLSEMLGFLAGCLGFTLLWLASHRMDWPILMLGILVLMVAVSARAGAFFIFPVLALWAGWVLRSEKRFSIQMSVVVMIVIATSYFLVSTAYSRLLDIPPGASFGNFSYAIYGQVRGGTGWHSAIEDLGTRNPAIVYRAAWEYFLQHPLSLIIGSVKSYRDFFWIGERGIFPFFRYDLTDWRDVLLWLAMQILLVRGIVRLYKERSTNRSSLLLAGFAGILLSIPFLPPIDGGSRFYAGTMPFFFALPAAGLRGLVNRWRLEADPAVHHWSDVLLPKAISMVLLLLVPVGPLLAYRLVEKPAYTLPACPAGQNPFAIDIHAGTYIDLVNERSLHCSAVPRVCLGDFETNNIEKQIDDYYQRLLSLAEGEESGIRIVPALNLVEDEFHYFYLSTTRFPDVRDFVTGCATEIQTKNQTIYQVESIIFGNK
ncbi:MAG TPA: hypothetical protein VFY26_06070 [Anaerolineales bacterium]|nr:hypothetical protein [Anaerolineales bacterium]